MDKFNEILSNVPLYFENLGEYYGEVHQFVLNNGMSERAFDATLVWTMLCVFSFFVTVVLSWRLAYSTKLLMYWYVYDFFVHVTLEGTFLYYSLFLPTTIEDAPESNVFISIWKEYAEADARWGRSDPTIVSLELLTVGICSILCVLIVSALRDEVSVRAGKTPRVYHETKSLRCTLEIILATMELYGGWMTFCPEWLTGSPALSTANPLHLWFYLVFQNMTWVVIPLWILVRAIRELKATGSKLDKGTEEKKKN